MFRGRYEHSVDSKGRIALPSTYRRLLSDADAKHLVVTTHLSDACLVAYPPEEWEAFEKRLAKQPQMNRGVILMRRLYVGNAHDCGIDKQGRILLPPTLRDYATIEKDACWVGGMRTLEIWSSDNWKKSVEAERENVGPEILEQLAELGI